MLVFSPNELGTRREFITLLVAQWRCGRSSRAQQSDRVRRIGALMYLAADDAEHDGLRPDDRDDLEHRWKPSIQLNQE